MGNVLATSKPITSAANQFLGANPETSPSTEQDGNKNAPEPLENPGTMEELHKKCKGECFHSSHGEKQENYVRNNTTNITSKKFLVCCFCYVTMLAKPCGVFITTSHTDTMYTHTCFLTSSSLVFISRCDAHEFRRSQIDGKQRLEQSFPGFTHNQFEFHHTVWLQIRHHVCRYETNITHGDIPRDFG